MKKAIYERYNGASDTCTIDIDYYEELKGMATDLEKYKRENACLKLSCDNANEYIKTLYGEIDKKEEKIKKLNDDISNLIDAIELQNVLIKLMEKLKKEVNKDGKR